MADVPHSRMYETIRREPADLREILGRGWDAITEAAGILAGANRVWAVGIGTSYHAALNAEYQFRLAGLDARAISSFDFTLYPPALREDDAVLVFSHRGFKRFSADAMVRAREAGVPLVAVTGLESAVADDALVLRTVAQEQSAAFTASHTAAMLVTAQLACVVGELTSAFDDGVRPQFEAVAGEVEAVLAREGELREMAADGLQRRVYAAGAGPDGPLALEVALKAREAAYTDIDALPTEQFLHGPMVNVRPDDMAILFATSEPGRARTAELAAVMAAVGLRTWVVGRLPATPAEARTFVLPEMHPLLAPVLAVVPLQLYACHQAQLAGTNADTFRRDLSPHREAFALVKL